MQEEAITRQEFSLMIAGTLISAASAGIVGVYLLIGHSVTDRLPRRARSKVAIENARESDSLVCGHRNPSPRTEFRILSDFN
jgi:hypothetical protein